ncbi:AraC family transcriptional regulator [Kitasatospora cystarginea]|uniref:AraC family transcriptional regulator n=1 Tax=Kitasatospora cystarginea TaxID=58350 RepID=A0ABP5R7M3_9ACTN
MEPGPVLGPAGKPTAGQWADEQPARHSVAERTRETRGPGPGGARNLAVPLHVLEVPAPQVPPFAIGSFDSIGPMSRAAFPHRHSFYEIVYIADGSGCHVVDLARRPLRPPHLCVITPGQVHHWEDADDVNGWVVLFNEEFLLAHPEDGAALRELSSRPWLSLDEGAARRFGDLIEAMAREYRAAEMGYAGVLRSQLHVLSVWALRAAAGAGDAPAAEDRVGGRPAELVAEFTRLIARPGQAERSVRSYARELGISAGYLSEIVKSALGLTPGSLIRRSQTLDAQRLLLRTDLTVRQIAKEAGFADPAYFCRFFRRETGLSPGEYRSRGGGNHHDPRIESIVTASGTA